MNKFKIFLLCIFLVRTVSSFAGEGEFISVWNTAFNEPEDLNVIILPLVPEGSYDFEVAWGDGNRDRIRKWDDATVRHEYAASGVYSVTINGKIEGWSFNSRSAGFAYHLSRSCLVEIRQWGCLDFGQGNISSRAFWNCKNFAVTAGDAPGLSQSTSLEFFFHGYMGAAIKNIEKWDVSNIRSMRGTFGYAVKFNADLSGRDTSSVRNMSLMFQSAEAFDSDLSSWNTSAVTTMESMFVGAEAFNGDVSAWDTSHVTDMSYMFNNARNFAGDLSKWDTSAVTTMAGMFINTDKFNCDLSGWDTSSVTNMSDMFSMAKAFNSDLSGWDVSAVKNMAKMFYKAEAFNGDVSSWDMSGVQTISVMFASCPRFNRDISGWDTSSISNMGAAFAHTDNFNSDISSWDTSNVKNMNSMFYMAKSFNAGIGSWDTGNVIKMSSMFSGAYSFDRDLSAWDISKVEDLSWLFYRSGLSDENYARILTGWSEQNVKRNLSLVSSARYTLQAGEARQKLIAEYGWSIEDQGPAQNSEYVPKGTSFDESLSELDEFVDTGLAECLPANKYEKKETKKEPGELVRIKYETTDFFDAKDVAAKVRMFRDSAWKFKFGKTRFKSCVDILTLPYSVIVAKNDSDSRRQFAAAAGSGYRSIDVILEYGYLKLYFDDKLVLQRISFDEQTMLNLNKYFSMNSWYSHSFGDSYIILTHDVRFRMKLLEIAEKLGDFAKTIDTGENDLRGFLEKGHYECAGDGVLYRFTISERYFRYAVFFREFGIGFLLRENSDGIIQAYETFAFGPHDFLDLQ